MPSLASGKGDASSPGRAPPTNLTSPTISGNAIEGQVLLAVAGTWSGRSSTYAFRWNRCDARGAACLRISSASDTAYTLTADDVGSTIVVTEVLTNKNGSVAANSAPTSVVSPPPLAAPTTAGATLTTSTTATTTAPATSTTTTTPTVSTSAAASDTSGSDDCCVFHQCESELRNNRFRYKSGDRGRPYVR